MGDFELERLLRSIRSLIIQIKENVYSPHTDNQADQGYDQPHRVMVLSEPDPHPAIREYYKAENDERPEKTIRERVRLGIEIVTLVAAVLAAVFTARTLTQVTRQADTMEAQWRILNGQWQTMRYQWRIMESTYSEVAKQTPGIIESGHAAVSSAETASKNLRLFEFQQRAWVYLTEPPMLFANGAEFTFRNFGGSPALRVTGKASPVEKDDDIATVQEKTCHEVADSGSFEVIFPGQSGGPHMAAVTGTNIRHLVGCISYADSFSKVRWTKFCYQPNARKPDTLISCLGFSSTDADSQH